MIKHKLTKYSDGWKRYASSWIQVNIFGKSFCFCVKRVEI